MLEYTTLKELLITTLGMYGVEIENIGSEKISGFIDIKVTWRLKPCYYYGIATAFSYPAATLAKLVSTKKKLPLRLGLLKELHKSWHEFKTVLQHA